MDHIVNLKKLSFLVYGLGSTGRSVIRYFKINKISNYVVWDDSAKLTKKFKSKNISNLAKVLKEVDYIVLSPGISLIKKKILIKYKRKIITDIDLFFLTNKNFCILIKFKCLPKIFRSSTLIIC